MQNQLYRRVCSTPRLLDEFPVLWFMFQHVLGRVVSMRAEFVVHLKTSFCDVFLLSFFLQVARRALSLGFLLRGSVREFPPPFREFDDSQGAFLLWSSRRMIQSEFFAYLVPLRALLARQRTFHHLGASWVSAEVAQFVQNSLTLRKRSFQRVGAIVPDDIKYEGPCRVVVHVPLISHCLGGHIQ